MVALRGVASVAYKAGSELDFVVIDGVQLPDRRTAERVPLTVFARLSHLDSDGNVQAPTDTVTSNVSVSGALLERRGEVDERSRLRIEMFFAGEPAPVCREAVFARQTDTHVGVKFTDTQEADRVRLAGILFRHQRRSSPE